MNEIEEMRQLFGAAREALERDGWTPEEIAEMSRMVGEDLKDEAGPGAERPFPMTFEERRECWRNWFAGKIGPAAGINQRMRKK